MILGCCVATRPDLGRQTVISQKGTTVATTETEGQTSFLTDECLFVGPSDSMVRCSPQDEDVSAIYASFVDGARNLVDRLRGREEQFLRLMRITERINYGVTLEQALEFLYQEMQDVIPYNRIGLSLIDRPRGAVVARWSRSDRPTSLKPGYEAQLKGSTLEQIIQTGKPRIINDLEGYLGKKPRSKSTRLMVREGMRSSLTCPLIVQGKPVGFLYFSSSDKGTYSKNHVTFFQQIAGQLATIVEKGRVYADLAEQKATVERQNLVMTHEMEMAQRVQRSLIPHEVPAVRGLDIAFAYEPATQVGGDTLDIIPLTSGRVLFFVADVMGHGVQASLVMSVVKATLSSVAEVDPHPPSILARINEVIARMFPEHFVTATCCLVDSDDCHAELSFAGDAGPIWFRASTGEAGQKQENEAGMPLGLAEDSQYEMTTIALDKEDVLLFYTDGIVEAFNPKGDQYGLPRLTGQLSHHARSKAQELCAGVRRDLESHCKDHIRTDDLTLLVVKLV